jgi:hypothetical protein
VAAAVRNLRADRPLVICIVVLAAMALAGLGLVITGWTTGSVHTAGTGGDWLFFAFFLALPGWTGWHLAKRQRKIAVEVKLDEVADDLEEVHDAVGRVEELLSPKAAPLAVVREFPRR